MGTDSVDENQSVWTDEAPATPPTPALDRDITADVAIIGGGFTGVSTAWHMSRQYPDRKIVLLEARVLGTGASGRNGGQVLNWINGVSTDDPAQLRRIHAITSQGIDIAETLATQYAPPDTFRRQGCLEVYTDAQRADAAHARVDRWSAAGIPVQFVPRAELSVAGAHGAVLDPSAGRLNGWALLQSMRAALQSHGVDVYEQTPVQAVHEGPEIRLTTPRGTVRSRAVVLGTNGYTPALGYFRRGVLPLHSHVLATAPLTYAQWTALRWGEWDGFSDDLDRISYASRTAGGRVVFGGGGNPAYSYLFGGKPVFPADRGQHAWTFMREMMVRYFPALADVPVAHRWSGTLGLTLDRVCTMGVRGRARNVYYALGYSGHGVALGLLAGRVLADLYAGNHDAWRDAPFYQRRLYPIPPEPFRWLGYQSYTRLTGRSPRRAT